jgi:HlyD family secretion protein
LLLVAIAAGAGAALYWWRSEAPKSPAVHAARRFKVQRADLSVRVRVTGQTAAKDYSNIVLPRLRSPEGDRSVTVEKMVNSGAYVKEGDVLAQFDTQAIRDHLDDTIAGLRDRENAVKKQQAALDLARVNLEQQLRAAKGRLDRARLDLKTAPVRSAIRVELFRLDAEEAEASYKALQQQLEYQMESQRAQLRVVDITRHLEVLHVQRHEVDVQSLTLRSPREGLVVVQAGRGGRQEQRVYEVGDQIAPGTLLMRVVDPDSMLVEGSVSQAEITKFRIGQEAKVTLDAHPGSVYDAEVDAIGALATHGGREQYYVRTVPLRLRMKQVDERVIPDLTAAVDVVVDRVEDALVVPAEVLCTERGRNYVRVEGPRGVERREVTAGASDGVLVAIEAGLEEGEIVLGN